MKYDTTLKKVFKTPNLLLSQALGRPVVVRQVLATDLIKIENAHPDLLFETKDGKLIHSDGRPIVFWIGPGKPGVVGGLNFPPALAYQYRVIDVRELDGEFLLEGGAPEESIFAVLCKLENPREAVGAIVQRIGEMPVLQQREAVLRLLVLSGLRGLIALVKDEVKRMPVSFDIHENEFLEEIYQEGVEKGRQEARILLVDLTEQKFGPLSAALKQRINSAVMDDVQRWIRRVLKSSTVEEIFQ